MDTSHTVMGQKNSSALVIVYKYVLNQWKNVNYTVLGGRTSSKNKVNTSIGWNNFALRSNTASADISEEAFGAQIKYKDSFPLPPTKALSWGGTES